MKKSITWEFVALFFSSVALLLALFVAVSGCFPGITGKVEVRADTKDFASSLASPSATASQLPTTAGGTVSSGLSDDDIAKIGKVVKDNTDNLPATSSIGSAKVKSLKRIMDGIYEMSGYGDGLFGGLSASGSVRALVRNQAVSRGDKLVLWMTTGASAGAYELQQNQEDVTESSYLAWPEVRENTFLADVTGTVLPAVTIDLTGKLFLLDPAQNIFGFAIFQLIGGWYPEQEEAKATERRVAWGKRMALLYLSGPGESAGWYRWSDPEKPRTKWDWGGMATKFVDDAVDSVVYVPATDSQSVALFSITTSTGKQTLVDEMAAVSAR